MDDVDESRKDEDKAFILRLPPDRAREVRQMIADNDFQDLRINIDSMHDRCDHELSAVRRLRCAGGLRARVLLRGARTRGAHRAP
jgi:hypothetical protein